MAAQENDVKNSCVNSAFSYSKDTWLVSVLNTGDKLTGHSMIVVEGIDDDGEKYFRQCDIRATIHPDDNSSINPRGVICTVNVREGERPNGYGKFSTSTVETTDINAVKEMMKSIVHDKSITDEAMEKYDKGYALSAAGFIPYEANPSSFFNFFFFFRRPSGHNCATWCAEKLKIAGVNFNSAAFEVLPKPEHLVLKVGK